MAKKKAAEGAGQIELTIDNLVDLVAGKEVDVEDTKLSAIVVTGEPGSPQHAEDQEAAEKLVKGAKKLLAQLEAEADDEDQPDDDDDLDDELDEDEEPIEDEDDDNDEDDA